MTTKTTSQKTVADVEEGAEVCYVLTEGPHAGQHRAAVVLEVHTKRNDGIGGTRGDGKNAAGRMVRATDYPQYWIDHNKLADLRVEARGGDDLSTDVVTAAYKVDQGWGSYHFNTIEDHQG